MLSTFLKASGGTALLAAGVHVYMALTAVPNPPPSPPVPEGVTRICITGYSYNFQNAKAFADTAKAHYLADAIAEAQPQKAETYYYWTMLAFYKFLAQKFDKPDVVFPEKTIIGTPLKGNAAFSPFVWLETGANNTITPIGGVDAFSAWALRNFSEVNKVVELANSPGPGLGFDGLHTIKGAAATCSSKKKQ